MSSAGRAGWPAHCAVAVVGGGVAGCATALTLARRGADGVAVFEAAVRCAERIGETIPPPSGAVLQRLGVWDSFAAQGHLSSPGSCASWGKPELGYHDFLLDRQGNGWHLDRAAFDTMLGEAVAAAGIPMFRDHRLRHAEALPGGGYALGFVDATGAVRTLTADFLVDATGVASGAVRRLGVARNRVDCLAAVWATADLAAPEDVPLLTLVEGAEHGWWYTARLPRDRMIVAFMTDPSLMSRRRLRDRAVWQGELQRTIHVSERFERGKARLARTPPGGLAATLAPSAILSRVVGPHWLAVGDAAGAYDPITSAGILKALRDGETAGEAVAALRGGGGEAALLAYQDGVFAQFSEYLRLRRQFYDRERRWPASEFWRRRQGEA